MRMAFAILALTMIMATAHVADAAVVASTTHAAGGNDLNSSIVAGDVISGLVATELAVDNGWHAAAPAEPERLQAITDDQGAISTLTGLLNDFPGVGTPTKSLQYDLPAATDLQAIQILTGNYGADGRIFSTVRITYSDNNGVSFSPLGGFVPDLGGNTEGYYQSNPSGVVNLGTWQATMLEIYDDSNAAIATGVTNLRFELYAVDNTQGQYRDPFDGVNPFTGVDDTLTAAIQSPLLWEIDVIAIPEPATAAIAGLGVAGLLRIARRRR